MRENKRKEPDMETKSERIPDLEGILAILKDLMGRELTENEYKEALKHEDEKGVYYLEVKIPGDSEGEEIYYAFMRKGRFPECQSSASEFHITYLKNGDYISGKSPAAKYLDDGIWEIIKDEIDSK